MRIFLLLFCLGIFVINARAKADDQTSEQQQTKSIGDGAEQEPMSPAEKKAMHADKHKMHNEMKKAMKDAKEKHHKAMSDAKKKEKAATVKKSEEKPPEPTEEQIKKADADEDGDQD